MPEAGPVQLGGGWTRFASAAQKTIERHSADEDAAAATDRADRLSAAGFVGQGTADAERRYRLLDGACEAPERGSRGQFLPITEILKWPEGTRQVGCCTSRRPRLWSWSGLAPAPPSSRISTGRPRTVSWVRARWRGSTESWWWFPMPTPAGQRLAGPPALGAAARTGRGDAHPVRATRRPAGPATSRTPPGLGRPPLPVPEPLHVPANPAVPRGSVPIQGCLLQPGPVCRDVVNQAGIALSSDRSVRKE